MKNEGMTEAPPRKTILKSNKRFRRRNPSGQNGGLKPAFRKAVIMRNIYA
jgi:hypothetical protein